MTRKSKTGPSVSFFAFQDIITSVVGVFVLITLTLMLEVIEDAPTETPPSMTSSTALQSLRRSTEDEVNAIRKTVSELARVREAITRGETRSLTSAIASLDDQEELLVDQERRNKAIELDLDQSILAQRRAIQATEELLSDNSELKDALRQASQNAQSLRDQLSRLDQEQPLIFRPTTVQGQSLIVIELKENTIDALDLVNQTREKFGGPDPVAELWSWIQRLGTEPSAPPNSPPGLDRYHFMLIVRPGGANFFDAIHPSLNASQASFGYDLLDSQRPMQLRSELMSMQEVLP